MPVQTVIKLRRSTAAQWSTANPVLASGEPGLETDTNKLKFGDGVTAWNSLDYSSGGASVEVSATAPADPQPNTLWFNSETGTMYIRYGSLWVETSPAVVGPQGPQGIQGEPGVQGPSGVISVTSPITNSGTTSAAVLGLNQSAITVSQSQVTNLTTDLAAKANLSGAAFTGNVSIGTGGALTLDATNRGLVMNSAMTLGAVFERAVVLGAFTGSYLHNVYPDKRSVVFFNGDSTASGSLYISGTGTSGFYSAGATSTANLYTVLSGGESITITFIFKQGATAYLPSNFGLDGTNLYSVNWLGGKAANNANATANGYDVITLTIFRPATGSAPVFFGTLSSFKTA